MKWNAQAEGWRGEKDSLLGSEHPSIGTSLSNLGAVQRDHGKLGEAETPIREVLAMRKKLLGDQHPSVADSQRDPTQVLALEHQSGSAGTGL